MAATLIFDRAGLAAVDRRAHDEFGIAVSVLMENAGRALADAVRALAPTRVLAVCGPGNNGGDGMVAARHLSNGGSTVAVALAGPRARCHGAAAEQLHTVTRMALPVFDLTRDLAPLAAWLDAAGPGDVIIDAVFGTGLTRPVEGRSAEILEALNASGRDIVAADLPSGLDCDTGRPLGAAVRAAVTVSFCGLKAGFAQAGAAAYTGRVVVGDIGAPRALLEACARAAAGVSDGPSAGTAPA